VFRGYQDFMGTTSTCGAAKASHRFFSENLWRLPLPLLTAVQVLQMYSKTIKCIQKHTQYQ
ncbi:MAG TPA: hypothetical protein O0X38_05265, partial [Methanocorpusculum sp.]|nr:hypothetical protein [Methanocorpusculum sp.]